MMLFGNVAIEVKALAEVTARKMSLESSVCAPLLCNYTIVPGSGFYQIKG